MATAEGASFSSSDGAFLSSTHMAQHHHQEGGHGHHQHHHQQQSHYHPQQQPGHQEQHRQSQQHVGVAGASSSDGHPNGGNTVGTTTLGDSQESAGTNAVNRSWRHLDTTLWMTLVALAAGSRAFLLHPLTLATARKRVSPELTTVPKIWRELYTSSGGGFRGISSLYRGAGVAVAGNMVGDVVYLTFLEYVREQLMLRLYGDEDGNLSEAADGSSWGRDAVGGMCGDLGTMFITTPFSVVMNRQMTAGFGLNTPAASASTGSAAAAAGSSTVYGSAHKTMQNIWSSSGLRGFYVGVSASLVMLPASGVWWGSYGEIKRGLYAGAQYGAQYFDHHANGSSAASTSDNGKVYSLVTSTRDNPIINGTAGIAASAFVAFVFNPLTVVRTRMQSMTNVDAVTGQKVSPKLMQVCRSLIKNEGYRAFFKGTMISISVSVTDGLLFSTLYEMTKLGSDTTK